MYCSVFYSRHLQVGPKSVGQSHIVREICAFCLISAVPAVSCTGDCRPTAPPPEWCSLHEPLQRKDNTVLQQLYPCCSSFFFEFFCTPLKLKKEYLVHVSLN